MKSLAPESLGLVWTALREASDDLGAMITWTQTAGSAAATAIHVLTEERAGRATRTENLLAARGISSSTNLMHNGKALTNDLLDARGISSP